MATRESVYARASYRGIALGFAHLGEIEWSPIASPSTQSPQSANAFQKADQADRGEHKEVRLSQPCSSSMTPIWFLPAMDVSRPQGLRNLLMCR